MLGPLDPQAVQVVQGRHAFHLFEVPQQGPRAGSRGLGYRITAAWGSHEGSILLWAVLLGLFVWWLLRVFAAA